MVFVSYRRDDSGMVAVDIVRALREAIEDEVFFDLGSIGIGRQFNLEISNAISRCAVVIVLLGRDWAGARGASRRIDDEHDVFRREIDAALSSSASVIPVLVGDMSPLRADELPAPLQPLAERHSHRIRLEDKWHAIDALVLAVEDTLEQHRLRRIYGEGGRGGSPMYRMLFDPSVPVRGPEPAPRGRLAEDVVFRINVALATGRLLAVVGADGSGRDQIAYHVASVLGWRAYHFAYSATSTPRDLLYSVDETRRLADAQVARRLRETAEYIAPGPLWWAFDPDGAGRRGARSDASVAPAVDPAISSRGGANGAVVLLTGDPPKNIDEYLRPLEMRQFEVRELGTVVRGSDPVLAVLSFSDVRAVDPWVRRRAVMCHLRPPTFEHLVALAREHTGMDEAVIHRVLREALAIQEAAGRGPSLDPRGVIDTLKAIQTLGIDVTDENPSWRALLDALTLG